ncbi:MAG TPA: thioredoxin domain-containing protein, partial [Myxococcaceae bacterium]|nr:thioredoxin domain-containing protein [Myxococcaceae bacterium]
ADAYVDGAAEVTLVGARPALRPFVEIVNRTYAPTTAVVAHDPATSPPPLLASVVADRLAAKGEARAYLCRNFTCEPPVSDPQALARSLGSPTAPAAVSR